MEISQEKYDELMARPTQAAFDAEKARADEATSEKAELETKLEQAETAKATAEQKATDAETALDAAREESRKATLASERMGALGKGFKAKLGEFTSQRLAEQASTYSDEEWDGRLAELEEMASVKRDEGGSDEDEDGANGSGSREGEFSREEVASARIGGGDGNGNGSEPSAQERRMLVGSLIPAKKSE